MSAPKVRKAEVVEVPTRENGYWYVVQDETGERHFMNGMGAPKGSPVGQKGTVSYVSGMTRGLWCFSPEAT